MPVLRPPPRTAHKVQSLPKIKGAQLCFLVQVSAVVLLDPCSCTVLGGQSQHRTFFARSAMLGKQLA